MAQYEIVNESELVTKSSTVEGQSAQSIAFENNGDVDAVVLNCPLPAGLGSISFINADIMAKDKTKYKLIFDIASTGTQPEVNVIRTFATLIEETKFNG